MMRNYWPITSFEILLCPAMPSVLNYVTFFIATSGSGFNLQLMVRRTKIVANDIYDG